MKTQELQDLGFEVIKVPEQQTHAGIFALPPEFDNKELAAHWVGEDQVRIMEQRQPMPGVGMMAPGLKIWRAEAKDKPKVVFAGKTKYTLMCRSRKVQSAMNAMYGNASKKQYNTAVQGGEAGDINLQDPGMLPEQKLRSVIGGSESEVKESLMPLNQSADEPANADVMTT